MGETLTRKERVKKRMYQAVPTKKNWLLRGFIDILVLFMPIILLWVELLTGNPIVTNNVPLMIVFYTVIILLPLFFGGRTVGMFIFGTAYINAGNTDFLRGTDYMGYLMESFWDRFKVADAYEGLSALVDMNHQSEPMKKHGVLIVRKRYLKMIKLSIDLEMRQEERANALNE